MLNDTSYVLFHPSAWIIMVIGFAAAWPIGRRLGERYGRRPVVGALLTTAVGVVLALTLSSEGHHVPSRVHAFRETVTFFRQLADPSELKSRASTFGSSFEELANVALFVPLGLFGYLLLRSLWRVVALGTIFSLFIEVVQPYVAREGDIDDVLYNGCGTALGGIVCMGALLVLGSGLLDADRGRSA